MTLIVDISKNLKYNRKETDLVHRNKNKIVE